MEVNAQQQPEEHSDFICYLRYHNRVQRESIKVNGTLGPSLLYVNKINFITKRNRRVNGTKAYK